MTDNSLSTVSNELLEHELTTLAGQIAAATCRFLVLIAELDRREAWGTWWGCKSMAHWLSWRCSLAPATAREHVRVAHALRSLPLTTAAFGRGELSYSKVRVLTRIATEESEESLVEIAVTATAAQLAQIVKASMIAMTDPAEREAIREMFLSVDDEGFGTTRTRMPIDRHAIVEQAIGKAVDCAPAGAPDDAQEGLAQRRADALVRIAEAYLVHGDGVRKPAARNNAVVHVDIDPNGVVVAETEAGIPVHPETARRLLCDATVTGMLGDCGLPIGTGRATRTINRQQRRALKKRSGGACEWKGCTERHYVKGHHVWHWEHGGPTELWNLVNLCWRHHRLLHEGGWRLEHDGRGGVRCYRPDGTELLDPIPTRARTPLSLDLRDESIVPLWAGERFDISACVDAVLGSGAKRQRTVRA